MKLSNILIFMTSSLLILSCAGMNFRTKKSASGEQNSQGHDQVACAEAQAGYLKLINEVVKGSGAKACQTSSDCILAQSRLSECDTNEGYNKQYFADNEVVFKMAKFGSDINLNCVKTMVAEVCPDIAPPNAVKCQANVCVGYRQ